jgi:hypothetical protein
VEFVVARVLTAIAGLALRLLEIIVEFLLLVGGFIRLSDWTEPDCKNEV